MKWMWWLEAVAHGEKAPVEQVHLPLSREAMNSFRDSALSPDPEVLEPSSEQIFGSRRLTNRQL